MEGLLRVTSVEVNPPDQGAEQGATTKSPQRHVPYPLCDPTPDHILPRNKGEQCTARRDRSWNTQGMKYLLILPLFVLPQEPLIPPLAKVDIHYMLRGYFYASSTFDPDLAGFGGWGGSENGSEQFAPLNGRSGPEVLVDSARISPFAGTHEGHTVILRNHGPDTLYFPAQDSRLYMKAQAKRHDTFRDIEYLPTSWCGNSYHTLYLAPGEQWEFTMPKYNGKKATRLRLELQYQRTAGHNAVNDTLYSHSFPGSVNGGQFTKKQGHHPQSIMDPYSE